LRVQAKQSKSKAKAKWFFKVVDIDTSAVRTDSLPGWRIILCFYEFLLVALFVLDFMQEQLTCENAGISQNRDWTSLLVLTMVNT
jgi:hypothetical protein